MGKMLLLITLLGDLKGVDREYNEASTQTRYALLETKFVKEELVEFENEAHERVYRLTGITKDEMVYFAYAYPLVHHKVSTKPFKNFKYSFENGFTLRPDFEYNFDKNYSAVFVLLKEF